MTTYNVQEVEKVVANRLKAPKGFFKWAETQFPIYTWSNKSRTIVSSERKEYSHKVKTKLLSTNSRLTFYSETKYFVWVGVTTKRIEMQMYAITQNIVDGKEKFSSVLYNFYQLANNKMIKAGLAGYSDYKPIYSNKFVAQGGMCGAFYNYYLYEDMNKLIHKLQTKSELKYLNIDKLVSNNLEISIMLPYLYKYRVRIEFAQKINARGILKDMVGTTSYRYNYSYGIYHYHVNMGRLTMNFLKKNKMYLKNTDINFEKAVFESDMRKQYGRTFEGLYELLTKGMISDKKSLIKCLDSVMPSTVKPIRFINWMMKNEVSLRDYSDYREMVDALGIPFNGDYVVIPKNWETKHTEIVENYSILLENQIERGTSLRMTAAVSRMVAEKKRLQKEKEEAVLRAETAERLANMMKAQTTFDKYAFIFPKDESEIVREGKVLHHCVGGYAKKHFVYGSSIIVFVRDKTAKETPLYTLELRNHRIIQMRGDKNKAPDEEAKKEAELFLAHCDKLNIQF